MHHIGLYRVVPHILYSLIRWILGFSVLSILHLALTLNILSSGRTVTSLSLYYRYCNGHSSSQLFSCILPHSGKLVRFVFSHSFILYLSSSLTQANLYYYFKFEFSFFPLLSFIKKEQNRSSII